MRMMNASNDVPNCREAAGVGQCPAQGCSCPVVAQKGLTLIEVLVALLVLSIGLVGIAALHLKSLQYAHSSYYSSISSSIALDLEERLWLLAAEAEGGCVTATQVTDEIVALQSHWNGTTFEPVNGNAVLIPGLQVTAERIDVGVVENSWTEVAISLAWTDSRFTDGTASESFTFTSRVICNIPPEDENEE